MTNETHAFVVLERWALEHKVTRLPSAKVLASLGEVTFLVTCLGDGSMGLPDNIRGEEGDDLVLVLDW